MASDEGVTALDIETGGTLWHTKIQKGRTCPHLRDQNAVAGVADGRVNASDLKTGDVR